MTRLFIHTIGCQMNVYDSERMAMILGSEGYVETGKAEEADLILVNTCAIRAKAEQKLFSYLGRLAGLKQTRPALNIGVGGCVAQQEGNRILRRMPHVDFVFGPDAIGRLPDLLCRARDEKKRIVDTRLNGETNFGRNPGNQISSMEPGAVSRFITIMKGCNNYCTYCVVPFVRGRERSREPGDIISEIRGLVAAGAREVTLLGQNVNSYGLPEKATGFPDLLADINNIEGLLRIRFATSHPKDLSPDLIRFFSGTDKLCRHIHLPVQSGSDRILSGMNRRYTSRRYMEQINALRDVCPDIAITSDIIVGFPGETDADFEQTINMIRAVEFDNLFSFKYSDRPNAAASRFKDKVPEAVKVLRLQTVLELQKSISIRKNSLLEGRTRHVLVEGFSRSANQKSSPGQLSGRTSGNKIVNFNPPDSMGNSSRLIGRMIPVRIKRGLAHSLTGRMIPGKGGLHRAA